jgi:hypothetical protein
MFESGSKLKTVERGDSLLKCVIMHSLLAYYDCCLLLLDYVTTTTGASRRRSKMIAGRRGLNKLGLIGLIEHIAFEQQQVEQRASISELSQLSN